MGSYDNLNSVTRTLMHRIWNGIKDDPQVRAIISTREQIISHLPHKHRLLQCPKVSVLLYNVTEYSSMRNQPQTPSKPQTLLYLKLNYLIVPLTLNAEINQTILGKIMQIFAETPVLRGTDLQGSLREDGEDLRIALDSLSMDDLSKLWTMLSMPYHFCVSYNVYPVTIKASAEPEIKSIKDLQPDKTP